MRIKFTVRTILFLLLAALLLAACGGDDDGDKDATSTPKTVRVVTTGEDPDYYVFRELARSLPGDWQMPDDAAEDTGADYEIRIDTSTRHKTCTYLNNPDINITATNATIQLVEVQSGDVIDTREFTGTLACPTQLGQGGGGGPSLTSMQSWAFTALGQHMGLNLRIQSHEKLTYSEDIEDGVVIMHPNAPEFLFLTDSSSNRLEVLNAETLEQRFVIENEDTDNRMLDAVYSPDGQWIATLNRDDTLKLWDAQTGAAGATVAYENNITRVSFSADSARLLLKGVGPDEETGMVAVWDIASGAEVYHHANEHNISAAIFSPDSSLLAISNSEAYITLVDLTTPDAEPITFKHRDSPRDMAFTPDNKRLITRANGGSHVYVWDTSNGEKLLEILPEALKFYSAALSPDGKTIATTYNTGQMDDWKVVIWDVKSGEKLHDIPVRAKLWDAEFSPNGRYIITYGDGALWILDTKTWQPVYWLMGHNGWVKSAVFTPDYRWLISSGGDGSIRQWDTSALAE